MIETLIGATAEAVIGYVLENTNSGDKVRTLIGRQPTQVAFGRALNRAYNKFSNYYPRNVESLFNEEMLLQVGVIAELSMLLTRTGKPSILRFANYWAEYRNSNNKPVPSQSDLIQATENFLGWFEWELKQEPELQSLFDSRNFESLLQELKWIRSILQKDSYNVDDLNSPTEPITSEPSNPTQPPHPEPRNKSQIHQQTQYTQSEESKSENTQSIDELNLNNKISNNHSENREQDFVRPESVPIQLFQERAIQKGSIGELGEISDEDLLWALLAYVFSPLIPIVILLMEDKKDRSFIRAHNVQSLVWGVLNIVFGTALSAILLGIPSLLMWLVSIYWGWQAYQGNEVTIPVVSDFVKGQGWA